MLFPVSRGGVWDLLHIDHPLKIFRPSSMKWGWLYGVMCCVVIVIFIVIIQDPLHPPQDPPAPKPSTPTPMPPTLRPP